MAVTLIQHINCVTPSTKYQQRVKLLSAAGSVKALFSLNGKKDIAAGH